MKLKLRKRHSFITITSIIVVSLWLMTDPDLGLLRDLPFGAGLVSTIVVITTSFLGLGILHITRKCIHDYKVADFKKLGEKAIETSTGAGLFAIAISIMSIAFAIIIQAVLNN